MKRIVVTCLALMMAQMVSAESLVLTGNTKTLEGELETTGITFSGSTPSSIVAPLGAKAAPGARPTSEFSDIHGVAVLSPDGTNPGVIDASASDSAGGKIETGLTDLVFDTPDACVSGSRYANADPSLFLPTNTSTAGKAISYWKDRRLADIKSVRAIIAYSKSHYECVARTCFFTNDGQIATMQFQARMSGECTDKSPTRTYLFGVKVTLKQTSEGHITAQANWARYAVSNGENQNSKTKDTVPLLIGECVDMDKHYWKSNQSLYSGPPSTSGGYGVRALMAGELASGDKTGGKGVAIKTYVPEREYDGELASTNETTAFTYWKNLNLDDIASMDAEIYAGSVWERGRGFFMNRLDAETLRVTFQRYAGDYTEMINEKKEIVGHNFVTSTTVEFKQDGNDVTARFVNSGHRFLHSESVKGWPAAGALPLSPDVTLRTNVKYNVRNIRLGLKPRVELGGPVDVCGGLKLSGGGTVKVSSPAFNNQPISGSGSVWFVSDQTANPPMTNSFYDTSADCSYDGQTVFDGGYHTISKSGAFSADSTIILTNNAVLRSCNADKKPLCTTGRYFVYPGCRLIGDDRRNFNDANEIFLFGGTMSVNATQYMGPLTLSSGAVVNGSTGFCFGNSPAFPHIYSIGPQSMTNRIDGGMQLYQSNTKKGQYGTIQTSADLILSGSVRVADPGYEGALVKKRGLAKLILSPTCTNPSVNANTACVEVVEGTLRNESATALRSVNSVELHNGAVYEAVGEAQTLGRLVVSDKSTWEDSNAATVRFENGGTLALPADGLEIVSGTQLVLDGDVGEGSFRVGTSACLPRATLSRVRIRRDGVLRGVAQDENGFFVVSGFVMIVR